MLYSFLGFCGYFVHFKFALEWIGLVFFSGPPWNNEKNPLMCLLVSPLFGLCVIVFVLFCIFFVFVIEWVSMDWIAWLARLRVDMQLSKDKAPLILVVLYIQHWRHQWFAQGKLEQLFLKEFPPESLYPILDKKSGSPTPSRGVPKVPCLGPRGPS